jgi:serine/threonine protein kinase
VYLAENVHTKELVVIKSIRKDFIIEANLIDNLKTESTIMNKSRYPFIINMLDVFNEDLRVYFLMPYYQCGDLLNQLQIRKRFTEEEVRFIAAQIVLALGYIHKNMILYRDLKPMNILVKENGYIVLADFGISASIKDNLALKDTFIGTYSYMCKKSVTSLFLFST